MTPTSDDFAELFGGPFGGPWLSDSIPESKELPQQGDTLFSQDGTIYNIACVNFSSEGWLGYVGGYLRGAHALIDLGLSTRAKRDYLVYPAVFLYRHYVELQLKSLHLLLLEHAERPKQFPKTHCLETLWREVRKGLKTIDDQPVVFDAAEALILEFQNLDPRSDAFRYPVKPDGGASLPRALQHINLESLRASMDRLATFFGSVNLMIEGEITLREEEFWWESNREGEFRAQNFFERDD